MYFVNWKSEAAADELKRMVDLRIPYPDIGRRFGVSVGAVCGKVHRLGIGKGPHKPDRLFVRPTKATKAQLTPDAAYFEIMERQEKEATERRGLTVSLEASEDHCCRYVIGDPTKRQLCGVRRHLGTPYCEEHARSCFSSLSHASRNAMGAGKSHIPAMNGLGFYPKTAGGGAIALTAIDTRTFEEADDPEAATVAA